MLDRNYRIEFEDKLAQAKASMGTTAYKNFWKATVLTYAKIATQLKSVLSILFIFLSILSIQAQNRNPVPKTDTFICDNSYSTNETFNVLSNDTDPNGDIMKVTSFRIGTSTTVYTVNKLYILPDKCIFAISSSGFITFAPLYFWTGSISFNYIVKDNYHTNGVRSYGQISAVYVCDCRDSLNRCLHYEQHP